MRIKTGIALLITGVALFELAGCVERGDCSETLSCPSEETGGTSSGGMGDGDGDSGGHSSGGTGDGDTGGTSGSGGTNSTGGASSGGMGGIPFSCTDCAESTPVCLESAQECVQCTTNEADHCEGDLPVCGPDNQCVQCNEDEDCMGEALPGCNDDNECVACTQNAHCTDPSASLCDADHNDCTACTENADCDHIEGLPLCDTEGGSCVECLAEQDCSGNVCDPRTHECTTLPAQTEFACEPCTYDAQCAPGHVCVEMSYDDPTQGVVGSFCLWLQDAGIDDESLPGPAGSCGLNSRPYAERASVTTVDGIPATVCKPRTTTCPSLLQHAKTITGCETPVADDAACGAPTFHDGRCRNDSSDTPLCTYPCLGNKDCPAGSTCPDVGDRVCSL